MALKYKSLFSSHFRLSEVRGGLSLWFSRSRKSGLTTLQLVHLFFRVARWGLALVLQVFKLGGRPKFLYSTCQICIFYQKANSTQTSSTCIVLDRSIPYGTPGCRKTGNLGFSFCCHWVFYIQFGLLHFYILSITKTFSHKNISHSTLHWTPTLGLALCWESKSKVLFFNHMDENCQNCQW